MAIASRQIGDFWGLANTEIWLRGWDLNPRPPGYELLKWRNYAEFQVRTGDSFPFNGGPGKKLWGLNGDLRGPTLCAPTCGKTATAAY